MNKQKLDIVEKKLKAKSETSGNKTFAIYSMMQHLEKTMIKANASFNDVMQFEKDFLEMNGIAVPESFIVKANDSVNKFIKEMLIDSENSLLAKSFYSAYVIYCRNNTIKPIGKHDVYNYLKSIGLLVDRATIDGETKNNVIKGKSIKSFIE